MTRNKTLAIVLSILFALVLVVALGQSVFRVGNIELVSHTTTNHLSSLNESAVLAGSELNKGKSVFLLDRETYIANLEKNQPYIKVLSIEVAWPNTIKFHYAERVELYAIALADGGYAYVDNEFKILRVSQVSFNSTQQNCILLDCGFDKASTDLSAGMFLDKTKFSDFVGIYDAYTQMGYSVSQMKSMISEITNETNSDGHTTVLQTFLGVRIQILNSAYYTSQKITLAYSMLETLDPSEYSSGTIYVFKNSQSVLESRYFA